MWYRAQRIMMGPIDVMYRGTVALNAVGLAGLGTCA